MKRLIEVLKVQSEAMGASVASTAIIPALISMARCSRRERQLEACMGCLALLCREEQNWPLLLSGNILRIAVDLLGPPSPGCGPRVHVSDRLVPVCAMSFWDRSTPPPHANVQVLSIRVPAISTVGPKQYVDVSG